jgi:hypothetical protein
VSAGDASALTLHVSAGDGEARAGQENVVPRHLLRFASRAELVVTSRAVA